jgi:hypothetical protein
MAIDPSAFESLAALGLGFAFAGLLSSGFECAAGRPLGFSLLQRGGVRALASVPVLMFSGPLLILRNTLRSQRIERQPAHVIMLVTIIACFWSLMSGRVIFDAALRFTGA